MIVLPASLIERNDLSLLERALLPLIALHTQKWGEKPGEIEASGLSATLRHSPREVVEALAGRPFPERDRRDGKIHWLEQA